MTAVRRLAGVALAALIGAACSPLFFSSASALDDPTALLTTPTTSTTSTSSTIPSTMVTTDDAAALLAAADPTSSTFDPLVALVDGVDGSTSSPDAPGDTDPTDTEDPTPVSDDGHTTPSSGTSGGSGATQGAARVAPRSDSPRVVNTSSTARAPQQPAATLPETRQGGVAASVSDALTRRVGPRPDGGRPTTFVVKHKTGLRSTADLFGMLDLLDLAPAALGRLVAPFPVAGRAHYNDDFGDVRRDPGGPARAHQGTDVFAERGTPVVAAARGSVTLGQGGRSGTYAILEAVDGTQYLYAHLDRFATRLATGDTVAKGEVLGFVGTTGNAASTPPHLHFEIRPDGGAAVDPVPFLDRWLADASRFMTSLRASPAGITAITGNGLASRSTSVTRQQRIAQATYAPSPRQDADAREVWTSPIAMMRDIGERGMGGAAAALIGALLLAVAGVRAARSRRLAS